MQERIRGKLDSDKARLHCELAASDVKASGGGDGLLKSTYTTNIASITATGAEKKIAHEKALFDAIGREVLSDWDRAQTKAWKMYGYYQNSTDPAPKTYAICPEDPQGNLTSRLLMIVLVCLLLRRRRFVRLLAGLASRSIRMHRRS